MLALSRFSGFYLSAFMIFAFACTNQTEKETVPPVEPDTTKTILDSPARAKEISGTLDTLWVKGSTFGTMPNKKLVFSFTFRALDTLTLHGWIFRKGTGPDYSNDPDIALTKGKASSHNYGNGTYFGNVVLYHKDVKAIKKVLSDSAGQYVLFAPEKLGKHVMYKVFVSREEPFGFNKELIAIPTRVVANPSPPKNQD